MDKLNGLLRFLDLVEKAELTYTLQKDKDSVLVSIAVDEGRLQVYFTGDGEILLYRLEDGKLVSCGAEILEGLFQTLSW